jgi:hypothetical protein
MIYAIVILGFILIVLTLYEDPKQQKIFENRREYSKKGTIHYLSIFNMRDKSWEWNSIYYKVVIYDVSTEKIQFTVGLVGRELEVIPIDVNRIEKVYLLSNNNNQTKIFIISKDYGERYLYVFYVDNNIPYYNKIVQIISKFQHDKTLMNISELRDIDEDKLYFCANFEYYLENGTFHLNRFYYDYPMYVYINDNSSESYNKSKTINQIIQNEDWTKKKLLKNGNQLIVYSLKHQGKHRSVTIVNPYWYQPDSFHKYKHYKRGELPLIDECLDRIEDLKFYYGSI